MMKQKALYLFILFTCITPFTFAQELTAEIKKQTIDTLSKRLTERYAYKEAGIILSALLQNNLQNKKYDTLHMPQEFAKAVTADMRSKNADKHLALYYDPQSVSPVSNNQNQRQETPGERAKRVSLFNRQMNFGFKNVSFFPGNIGYIKFDYFDAFPDYSKPVVNASFGFLKNSDAIIIDLRDNTGGGAEMVSYILGFFFDTSTFIGSSYNRYTDSITNEYVQPSDKSILLSNADVYILTSNLTVSAAEALAYVLKYQKKAIVIGETSVGAANPGRVTRLNRLFTAFIPNRHSMNALTKTNWEGTGVPVDIKVPAEDAFITGRIEALKKMKQRTGDSAQIKKYDQYLSYLRALATNEIFTPKSAAEYAGVYDNGTKIIYGNGKLYYKTLEAGNEMVKITGDLFLTEEGSTTIRFIRNEKQKVTSAVYTWILIPNPITLNKLK